MHKNFKLIFLLLLIIVLFGVSGFTQDSEKTQETDSCFNPYELKDSTAGVEAVRICENTLYRGNLKVVHKDEFKDLFEYSYGEDSEPDKVTQYVRVFERDKQEYVSLKSVFDSVTWNQSAIGIYRKEGDAYKQIFKKGFEENTGRWVDIEFGEDVSFRDPYFYLNQKGDGISISGDIGYLGCYGACRMLWWDFYDWDERKKTYVLSNNKHPESFKKLLESYEDFDKNTCMNEASVDAVISELYPLRKDKVKICTDTDIEPTTTVAQAEMLLKGIKAINRIIEGENISMNEVKDIELD